MLPQKQKRDINAISTALEADRKTTTIHAADEHIRKDSNHSQPESRASFRDYLVRKRSTSTVIELIVSVQRIFSYAGKWDILLLIVAALSAIGSGIVSISANTSTIMTDLVLRRCL